MNLPDLEWQWLYSRLAWGMVVAALLVRAWPGSARRLPRAALLAAGLAVASMWLPHTASPAYWLGLMFQYPSVMLVAWLVVPLASRHSFPRGAPIPEARFALVLALGGAWLYADSSGWLNASLYSQGFDHRWAPAAVLLAGAWAVWAVRSAATRASGLVVLACVMVFSLTRLPSGNAYDAFLDPFMWVWAVGVTLVAAVRWAWRWWRAGAVTVPQAPAV